MENKTVVTKLQSDKFWRWRVNREEELILKQAAEVNENEENLKRLQNSITKAQNVAARLMHRSANKGINTD